MADEDRGSQLPQRTAGTSRPGPSLEGRPRPQAGPAISDDLRQRIQAAVAAERAKGEHADGERANGERADGARGTADAAASPGSPGQGNGANGAGQASAAVNGTETRKSNGHKAPGQPERTKARLIGSHVLGGRAAAAGRTPAAAPPAEEPAEARPIPPRSRLAEEPAARPAEQPAGQPKQAGSRRFRLIALAAVALAAVTGALAVPAMMRPAHSGSTAVAAPDPALLRLEAATRDQAASWVAQQVSPAATVACDPVMCAALAARGFPARSLLRLGPTSPEPVTAAVVVATAAVRGMFGSSLSAALAPAALASFGSGPAGITVRVIAPHGAAAYQAALGADQAIRKTDGSALLNNSRITLSGTARSQLATGRVDSRLLLAVASLATAEPIDVVQFGNIGQGADPRLPLRFADLATSDQAAHVATAAYVKSAQAAVGKLNAQFRPARAVTAVLPDGQPVLRVEFTAPSPLGLFGG